MSDGGNDREADAENGSVHSGGELSPAADMQEDVDIPEEAAKDDENELYAEVEERCRAAGIDCERKADFDGNVWLRVCLPAGHDKRVLMVRSPKMAHKLLSLGFEHWRYLEGYEAIYSYADGDIEAVVRPVRPMVGRLLSKVFPTSTDEKGVEVQRPLVLQDAGEGSGVELRLNPEGTSHAVFFDGGLYQRRRPTLTIRGLTPKDHDHARQALENYGNALLFQIDAKLGLPLQLTRERRREPLRFRRLRAGAAADLVFPQIQYDREPMSLYWYGRAAAGMPLLQFLAYYQVVEFYFPVYAQAEIRRRLRTILKDPAFTPHSDRQIGRLTGAFSSLGGRNIWGDELAQLRATLHACLNPAEVREFISDSAYEGYFDKKVKQLTNTTLRAAAGDDELVSKTAERIYEIRCKIVHTKEDRNVETGVLLPFSREADRLGPEIDLVEFAARRVLAAAGKQLGSR